MTNTLGLIFGSIIIGLICVDIIMFDGQYLLFLMKKFADLIEWLAFWR